MKILILYISAFGLIASEPVLSQPAQRYGAGTITRSQGGKTEITTRYGNGAITRSSGGGTEVTTRYGHGAITRDSKGRTSVTTPYGKQLTRKPRK